MSKVAANEDPPTHALRWKNYGSNKNISGFTTDNELFGILGMGDTKSILIRSLCGQRCAFATADDGKPSTHSSNTATSIVSQTYYNEREIGMGNIPENFVFIENSDVRNLYENLTVLEVLIFSAELRIANPSHPSDLAALRLLNEIGLEDISYKTINELSVWEKRAMIFATEVITDKTVVFFDQPTQDLDGHSALSLITVLQRCARSNRIIMITSSSLTFREYAILDRIQLLSDRGYIYIGPGSNAVNYFSKLGRTPSPGASISDFLLDLVDESPGFVDLSILESAVSKLCYTEYTSPYSAADFMANGKSNEVRHHPPISNRNNSNHYDHASWAEAIVDRCFEEERDCMNMPIYLKCFFWCLWRSFIVRWRNIDETFGVWGLAGVFVLLGLLLVFSSFRHDSNLLVADFENTASLLTILPFSIAILSLQWNKDEVIDRYVYSYERDKGYYCHSSIFPIASIIADLFIYRLFPPIFVVALLYPFLGLQSGLPRVCVCIAAVTMICMNLACMNRLVFNVMAVKKDFLPVKCSMVSAFLTTLQILYTGLLLNLKNYSSPNAFMKSWSSFYWGCNILYWNELANRKFYDSDNDGILIGADILNDDGAYYVNQRAAFEVLGVQMIIYIVLSVLASILLHREWNYAVKYYYSTLPVYILGEYTGKILDRIWKYFKA